MAKQIDLNDKDISELRRLRRCLNSKMVPLDLLESFLGRIQDQVEQSTGPEKAAPVRIDRRAKYRSKFASL